MPQDFFAREINYKGEACVELAAAGYYALIAPNMGSQVLRLRDTVRKMEILHFDESVSIEEIRDSQLLYGLPTMIFPSRLDNGMLETTDAFYRFIPNEPPPNSCFIHGFLHKRAHSVVAFLAEKGNAVLRTSFLYSRSDEHYREFPLDFRADFVFNLSEKGLEKYITITNLSEKRFPIGLGSHTAINAPFVDGGSVNKIRLYAPIGEKWTLDKRALPTGEIRPNDAYDMQYVQGLLNPVTIPIEDVYSSKTGALGGEKFHGIVMEDISSGKKVCYETGVEYGFWVFWNNGGNKDFFCTEPLSWMVNAPNLTMPKEKIGYREIFPEKSFTAYERLFSEG